jgi:hypothetical protein
MKFVKGILLSLRFYSQGAYCLNGYSTNSWGRDNGPCCSNTSTYVPSHAIVADIPAKGRG